MTLDAAPIPPRQAPLRVNVALAAITLMVYVVTTTRLAPGLQITAAIVLAGALIHTAWRRAAWQPWGILVVLLSLGVALRPLDMPNHHFVMTYLSLAMALSLSAGIEQRTEYLRQNARWILVVLMGFATLHKCISVQFLDGSYLGYMLARGEFAAPLIEWIPNWRQVFAENRQIIDTFRQTPPTQQDAVTVAFPAGALPVWAYGFAASILLIEGWLCVSMWLMPKRLITHLSLLAFAVSLALLRQEFMFISVICLLGLLTCDPRWRWRCYGYRVATLFFLFAEVKP